MKLWIYKHYKWWMYEVIWIWNNSENLQKEVIYKMLYDTSAFSIWTLWVRPYNMFNEEIIINWKKTPRFEYIWNKKYKDV